jgi:putative acetyltransferase
MKARSSSNTRAPAVCRSTNERTVLRPFRAVDYDAVFKLWRRCPGVGLGGSDTRSAITAYLRRNPGFSFVVQKNGEVIGAVLAGHDGRRGYLHHLAVAQPYRRAGLGRQLVESCLAKLHKAGIQKCNIFVFADNAEGMKFWARAGWAPRQDLRMLQIDLAASRPESRSC